jgi:predicted lactoylglutathione lyase
MKNEFWISLPVKNLRESIEFYKKSTFDVNEFQQRAVLIGGKKQVQIMLYEEVDFKNFIDGKEIGYGNEIILSFQVESEHEIDSFASAIKNAGGEIIKGPMWSGKIYCLRFKDINGHIWESLYYSQEK